MYSYTEQVATGETNVFPVPFPYILPAHLHVFVDGVETPRAILTGGTVQVAVAGEAADLAGKLLVIQRITPSQDLLVTFTKGGLDFGDLNRLGKQLLYLAQEAADAAKRALNLDALRRGFDFRGFRGINAGDPLDTQDVATAGFVERRVVDIAAGLGISDQNGGLVGLLRESIRVLPTTEPVGGQLPWINGGVLCVTSGDPVDLRGTSPLAAYLRTLPTTAPAGAAIPWNNGGVICLTPGQAGGSPVPSVVQDFTTYLLTRPFMPVDSADVPEGGAWFRFGTEESWTPNFVGSP